MRTCRRNLLPSDASPARDTPHMHARAHGHALTKCPRQDLADENGQAGARHHHALHQQFLQPGAERLSTFLNNLPTVFPVTFDETNGDSTASADGASTCSLAQRDSLQPAFHTTTSTRSTPQLPLQHSAAAGFSAARIATRVSKATVLCALFRPRYTRSLSHSANASLACLGCMYHVCKHVHTHAWGYLIRRSHFSTG